MQDKHWAESLRGEEGREEGKEGGAGQVRT